MVRTVWKNSYIPFSLSDYPGEITAILFFNGCNFSCGYCHNSWLAQGNGCDLLSYQNSILSELGKQKKRIDAVTISGGEALCTSGLKLFIQKIRELGFKIKLDTNGSFPEKLTELLSEDLLDYVALDLKAPLAKYCLFTNDQSIQKKWRKTYDYLRKSKVKYEVRTTMIRELFFMDEYIDQLKEIEPLTLFLQKFRNEEVLDKSFKMYTSYNDLELKKCRKLLLEKFSEIKCSVRN